MPRKPVSFGVMCAADMLTREEIQQFARQAENAGLDQVWIPELLGRDPFLTASLILEQLKMFGSERRLPMFTFVMPGLQSPRLIRWLMPLVIDLALGWGFRTLSEMSREVMLGYHR